jgi:hypothetical protein
MKQYVLLFAITLLCSCNDGKNQGSNGESPAPSSCKGVFYERDSYGELKKFNQFWQADQQTCLTDKIALTKFENSTELRRKRNVACVPQPTFPSMALKASGNYYDYRNDRMFLDFDAVNGTFRRLTIGEDKNGNTVFQRDVSCFYVREDHETEPVNPRDYGKQLLLDFSNFPASSASFVPNEIFKYDADNVGNWYFTRYDDVADWSYTFCPESTPWNFCSELRNGNLYYYPILNLATQAKLLIEAKLIRTQFNFVQISQGDFESLWKHHDKNTKEVEQGGDWRFYTNSIVDASKFFDYDWRLYLMNQRYSMPDAFSPALPLVCYASSKFVTLTDGSVSKIYGETCIQNGVYTFVQ